MLHTIFLTASIQCRRVAFSFHFRVFIGFSANFVCARNPVLGTDKVWIGSICAHLLAEHGSMIMKRPVFIQRMKSQLLD